MAASLRGNYRAHLFLHVTEGEELTPDLEGVDRADACAAQKAAIDGVSELIAEAVKMGERNYKGRIDAEDEQARCCSRSHSHP